MESICHSMFFNTCLILLITMLFSCDKETDTLNSQYKPPISQSDMWACHHKEVWDTLRTHTQLIGEWEWEYIGCFWTPEKANNEDFEGMTIEFKASNELIVKQNGEIIQESHWRIIDGDADLYALHVEPGVTQLYGRILFCGDRVEFNNSYIDGCDNYFRRKS